MSKKMTFFCIITNSDKKDNYEKASDIKRTWRFLGQFNRKKIKKLELGKRWT